MAFIIWNNKSDCAHRHAGRVLCRLAGMGAMSISQLAELMDVVRRSTWMEPSS